MLLRPASPDRFPRSPVAGGRSKAESFARPVRRDYNRGRAGRGPSPRALSPDAGRDRMADPHSPAPVLLVVAAFSRHAQALAWGRRRLEDAFGPVALDGPLYPFHQTAYYEATMGPDLRKQLLVFRDLVAADALADLKQQTDSLERELAAGGTYPEPRPLNLDPGALTLNKFVLASGKDGSQRVYLRDGVFAEVTLRFHDGAFEPWPWTYADYREPAVLAFLAEARRFYRRRLRERTPAAGGAPA